MEHDCELLRQAKPTGVVGGVGSGVLLQDFPPDVEIPPLVLQLPHVAGQGGADPLVTVLHVGLVAAVPFLPWWFCHTHIELVGLAHGGLVLDLVVEASGAVHGAVDGPSSAVAVLVARQLVRQLIQHILQQPLLELHTCKPHVPITKYNRELSQIIIMKSSRLTIYKELTPKLIGSLQQRQRFTSKIS